MTVVMMFSSSIRDRQPLSEIAAPRRISVRPLRMIYVGRAPGLMTELPVLLLARPGPVIVLSRRPPRMLAGPGRHPTRDAADEHRRTVGRPLSRAIIGVGLLRYHRQIAVGGGGTT